MKPCPLQPGQHLAPHRVIARNGATLSENKIHADDVARSHGFRGGLVPGITTFAYMTRPVIDAVGLDWLQCGQASARLFKPVYEGEQIDVCATVTAVDTDGATIDLVATGDDGETRATGKASFLVNDPPPIDLSEWPKAPLPAVLAVASRAALAAVSPLGSLELHVDANSGQLAEVDDDPPAYRDAAVVHPARMLAWANEILAANVTLGPWLHLASEVELRGPIRHGDHVSVRGRIDRLFEKKGRELVDLDVLIVVNDAVAAARVKHTAIYRL